MNKYLKALSNIYTAQMDDFEMLQKLVDKEAPMKPIKRVDGIFEYYKCPNCERLLRYYGDYCHDCGQKLDWSDKNNEI